MKKMLLGIFLMQLSTWCFVCGYTDNFVALLYISLLLLIPATILVYTGYKENDK